MSDFTKKEQKASETKSNNAKTAAGAADYTKKLKENRVILLECLNNLSALNKVQGALISQMENKLK